MKKLLLFASLPVLLISLTAYLYYNNQNKDSQSDDQTALSQEETVDDTTDSDNTDTISEDETDLVCGWIDEKDVVIKLTFAEGVTKEATYEAGFSYTNMIRTARLARVQCDYRTGFDYNELAKESKGNVAVWGYLDSNLRTLKDDPVSVMFTNGKPDISDFIEVEVTN